MSLYLLINITPLIDWLYWIYNQYNKKYLHFSVFYGIINYIIHIYWLESCSHELGLIK